MEEKIESKTMFELYNKYWACKLFNCCNEPMCESLVPICGSLSIIIILLAILIPVIIVCIKGKDDIINNLMERLSNEQITDTECDST